MLDGFHILTVTHRNASLDTISRAVLKGEAIPAALMQLKNQMGWEELMYLATCNRVMYLYYSQERQPQNGAEQLIRTLRPDMEAAVLEETIAAVQVLNGEEAIRHLLEVSASMDSLVVGEREIIRQLREAYNFSQEAGITGDHMRLLLRFTIETAKEIYTQTGIGEKALSIVALAFNALMEKGLDKDARVLMIGAGETNAKFAKFMQRYGYRNITVFNRSFEKAEAIAEMTGGRAFTLDSLPHYSGGFDALVVCTGSTTPLVDNQSYRSLLNGESGQKIVVDLSVPNNVDRQIVRENDVHLIEIENLREAARENLAFREQESKKASEMIGGRIYTFRDLWHERQVERSMAHIPEEVRAVKEKAVNEVFSKEFTQLSPEHQELVMRMLGYMEKKCVAIPIKTAKQMALRRKMVHK